VGANAQSEARRRSFFEAGGAMKFEGKRVGLITNHTGVNGRLQSTIDLFKKHTKLVALFAPEHGLNGQAYAFEKIEDKAFGKIPFIACMAKQASFCQNARRNRCAGL